MNIKGRRQGHNWDNIMSPWKNMQIYSNLKHTTISKPFYGKERIWQLHSDYEANCKLLNKLSMYYNCSINISYSTVLTVTSVQRVHTLYTLHASQYLACRYHRVQNSTTVMHVLAYSSDNDSTTMALSTLSSSMCSGNRAILGETIKQQNLQHLWFLSRDQK